MTSKKSAGLVIDILKHEMDNDLGHWLSDKEKYKHVIEQVREKHPTKYLAGRKAKMAADAFALPEARETNGTWTAGSGRPFTEKEAARPKAKQSARAKGRSSAPLSKSAQAPSSAPTPAPSMKQCLLDLGATVLPGSGKGFAIGMRRPTK